MFNHISSNYLHQEQVLQQATTQLRIFESVGRDAHAEMPLNGLQLWSVAPSSPTWTDRNQLYRPPCRIDCKSIAEKDETHKAEETSESVDFMYNVLQYHSWSL